MSPPTRALPLSPLPVAVAPSLGLVGCCPRHVDPARERPTQSLSARAPCSLKIYCPKAPLLHLRRACCTRRTQGKKDCRLQEEQRRGELAGTANWIALFRTRLATLHDGLREGPRFAQTFVNSYPR